MSTPPRKNPPGRPAAPSFDGLVQQWLTTLGASSTRAVYGRDLVVYVRWTAATGNVPLAATTADVDHFRSHLMAAGDGPATANRRIAALSSFFRFAAGVLGTESNPVRGAVRSVMSTKSDTAQLNDDQADAVWSAAVQLGHRTATVVGLVLLDGLKTNELLLLDAEHVEVRRGRVVVRVARRTGDEPIVIDQRTAASLRRSLAGRASGPLLLGENPTIQSARLTRFGVDYIIKRAGATAGLASPLTANILRSTHIRRAHAAGTPVDDLQRSVGHASRRTTLRYIVS